MRQASHRRLKAPPKLVCLETYWNEKLFQTVSVKGFFEAMAPLARSAAHRRAPLRRVGGRARALREAARRRDVAAARAVRRAGVLPRVPRPARRGFASTLGRIGAASLCEAFAGYGGYRNLVYFAACNVLRGERGLQFARAVPQGERRARGDRLHHAGDWMASLVADMLFLHRFYSDPSPWRNLRRIFASVLRDYPRARRLGYTLVTRKA